jgi:YHS domain-containing protein
MNRTLTIVAAFLAALLMQATALAEGTARVVLKGYDPVAYFTDGKPMRGNARISYEFDEGRYYFVNESHRAMFAAAPERYAPQFGGYCTGSMSRGVRNDGHPEARIIADEKLYVFGAADLAAALQIRERAQTERDYLASRIPKAMKNWQAMR